MKPASDAELKSEIDSIVSRIENIVRTVNRHAPGTATTAETDDSVRADRPAAETEND